MLLLLSAARPTLKTKCSDDVTKNEQLAYTYTESTTQASLFQTVIIAYTKSLNSSIAPLLTLMWRKSELSKELEFLLLGFSHPPNTHKCLFVH